MNMKRNILIAIIWFIFVYVIMILFTRCSAEYHLNKAIKKGAEIKVDTAYQYVYRTDTLYNEKTNTYTVTKFVVDSIPYLVTKKIYVPMSRQERLMYRDSLSHIRKLYELETKRVKLQSKEETKQTKAKEKRKKKTSPVYLIRNIIWLFIISAIIYFLIKLNRSL